MRGLRKCCWVARESVRGWTLMFDYGFGKGTLGVFFRDVSDVEKALNSGVVYVHKMIKKCK